MKVGFIGLGHMGAGMAARLCQAGHEVTVYNRTEARMQPLVAQGAKAAHSVAEACAGDVVCTMLADDLAAAEVVLSPGGVVDALKPGAVHVSCSTISVAMSREIDDTHVRKQQGYVAAPVFGRPDMAAAGKLFVVAAGNQNIMDQVQPVFDALGQRTFIVSAQPEQANLVKLSGNFMLAAAIESLGEAMALAEKGGIDRHQFLDLLTSTLFNVPLYKNYGSLIADRKFEPGGFSIALGHKDLRLALEAAEELKVPLPLAGVMRDRYLTLEARGDGHLDLSALGGLAARDAALL